MENKLRNADEIRDNKTSGSQDINHEHVKRPSVKEMTSLADAGNKAQKCLLEDLRAIARNTLK